MLPLFHPVFQTLHIQQQLIVHIGGEEGSMLGWGGEYVRVGRGVCWSGEEVSLRWGSCFWGEEGSVLG